MYEETGQNSGENELAKNLEAIVLGNRNDVILKFGKFTDQIEALREITSLLASFYSILTRIIN